MEQLWNEYGTQALNFLGVFVTILWVATKAWGKIAARMGSPTQKARDSLYDCIINALEDKDSWFALENGISRKNIISVGTTPGNYYVIFYADGRTVNVWNRLSHKQRGNIWVKARKIRAEIDELTAANEMNGILKSLKA